MQNFLYSFLKKYSSKKIYKEDISCGIMDLKYDDSNNDSLKILEFGEIEYSAFKGHESLFGPGKIWGNLWQYLAQFKKPIWYVSSKVSSRSNDKAIDVLYKLGGLRKKSFEDLEKDNNFKLASQASTSCAGVIPGSKAHAAGKSNSEIKSSLEKKINPEQKISPENDLGSKTKIQDYKGIIVIKNRSNRKTIKDKLGEFIVLNDKFTKYCENKHNAALLFKGKELEKFKPMWQTYPFEYSENLATKILKDLKCDTVVIKPINATRGEGVIIVEKEDLDKTLKKILCYNNLAKNINSEYAFWSRYKENIFLVESFEKSKSILVDKKKYDATMRIVFVMSNNICNNEKTIEFKIIGAYWKLPIKSISQKGSLNDKHKSKIVRSVTASARVSDEDIENVGKIMETIIPKIYKRVLEL